MATTVQDVFDLTLPIIDAVGDSDISDYKDKTLGILNVLRGELFPYSDTWKVLDENKRPIVQKLTSFDDEIGLDDYICQTLMPYGLGAHLMLTEDTTTASYCQQRYDELKQLLTRGLPTESTDIEDVYAGQYWDEAEGKWKRRNSNGIGFEWTTRWNW